MKTPPNTPGTSTDDLGFLDDAEEDIDALKAKMALLHDIVEIDAGDTYTFDEKGYEDKFEKD